MTQNPDSGSENEKRGVRHVLWGIGIVAAFILAFAFFVQLLWNGLMPAIFGLKTITYLQALGLLILTRLLFGRVGQRRDHAGYLTGKYGFRSIIGRGNDPESNPGGVQGKQ